jgi:uncharacterized Zn-binding protein involved in type VI secretion
MSNAARKYDTTSGHGDFPSQTITTGSSNVFINGKPAVREGDLVSSHCISTIDGQICHSSSVGAGSPNVFVNGKRKAHVNTPILCGGVINSGSPNVRVN